MIFIENLPHSVVRTRWPNGGPGQLEGERFGGKEEGSTTSGRGLLRITRLWSRPLSRSRPSPEGRTTPLVCVTAEAGALKNLRSHRVNGDEAVG